VRAIPGALSSDRPMRVALVRAKARAQWLVSDAVFGALRFNGKSAMENGSDFRQFILADTGDVEDPAAYRLFPPRLQFPRQS